MTLTTLSVLRTDACPLCIQHGLANVTFTEDKENDTPARLGEFETAHEKMEVSSGCKRWVHGVRFVVGVFMLCEPLRAQADGSVVRRRALTEKGFNQVRRGDRGSRCCRYATR